jgi:hypothetical protein
VNCDSWFNEVGMDEGAGTVDTFHSIDIICITPSKFTKYEVEMDFLRDNGCINGNDNKGDQF